MKQNPQKTYTVIYRVGGTKRFTWHRCFDSHTDFYNARLQADVLEHQGYKALIHNTAQLNAIGLPDTWE